ncbi:MAG: 50S ribosomal protein L4 [Omnitrophica WOR_2 bacterium SM23_29]|nr:MAG: 50S ribosomal protein L4 [Omnitrophica WOR_2 bacterium SM23_29]
MAEVPVYNMKGQAVGKMALDKNIFNGEVNEAILYQAIKMYESNLRQGTASTKTRSQVSGGGKKPWRQKGTGRARAGTIRSPLWRGGGIIFGPHPRDYSYAIPKKIRRLALISSLNAKLNNGELVVLEEIKIVKPKTREFMSILRNLKADDKPLVVVDDKDKAVILASRNIPELLLRDYKMLNAYEVLKQHKLILTQKALNALTEQLVRQ